MSALQFFSRLNISFDPRQDWGEWGPEHPLQKIRAARRYETLFPNSTRYNEVYNPKGWVRAAPLPFSSYGCSNETSCLQELRPAEDCWASVDAYNFYISKLYEGGRYLKTETYTETYVTRRSLGGGEFYSVACDGIPRFRFTASPTAISTSTFTVERIRTITAIPEFDKLPQIPTCGATVTGQCIGVQSERLKSEYNKGNPDFGRPDTEDPLYAAALGFIDTPCQNPFGPWHCIYDCKVEIDDEVILIYWPDENYSRNICDAKLGRVSTSQTNSHSIVTQGVSQSTYATVITDKIVFRGPDVYKTGYETDLQGSISEYAKPADAFTLIGNFTFVSPTVYLAYRSIRAQAAPTNRPELPQYRETMSAGVVALNASDVYTLQPQKQHYTGTDYARLVASGSFTGEPNEQWVQSGKWVPKRSTTILPINYDLLEDPVPANVHYDALADFCWGANTKLLCATITDGSYRPQLAFKKDVWHSIFTGLADANCAVPRIVDPNIALRPAQSLDIVDLPSFANSPLVQATEPIKMPAPIDIPGAEPGTRLEQSWPAQTTPPEANRDTDSSPEAGTELFPANKNIQLPVPTHTIRIGSQRVVAMPGSGSEGVIYIGTSSLLPGQVSVVNGHTVSVANNAVLVDDSVAFLFSQPSPDPNNPSGSRELKTKEAQTPHQFDGKGNEFEWPGKSVSLGQAGQEVDGLAGSSSIDDTGMDGGLEKVTTSPTTPVILESKTRSRSTAHPTIGVKFSHLAVITLLMALLLL